MLSSGLLFDVEVCCMRILILGDHSSYHCGSNAVWRTIQRQVGGEAEIVKHLRAWPIKD